MFIKKFVLREEAGSAGGSSGVPSAPMTQAGSSPVIDQSGGNEPGTPAPKAAAPAKPEYFEVKVNGKTMKMTRDELIQNASLGMASDQRFKEASQLRKEAEGVIGRLRDPEKVIEALLDPSLGLTKDQIRAKFEDWYAKEFIEPESLTPEQRENRDLKAKIQKYADDEKGREAEKAKAHEESLTTQAREEIQNEIISALETGKLSKTNASIRRLAKWIRINQGNGFNAPPEVLVAQVKKEISQEIRDLTEASDGEVLIQLLGEDVIQKLRRFDLDQLRKLRQGGSPPATPEAPRTPASEPLRGMDVNQRIRELQRTGRY